MFKLTDVSRRAAALLKAAGVVNEAHLSSNNYDYILLNDDVEVIVNDMTLNVFNASGEGVCLKTTDFSYFTKF